MIAVYLLLCSVISIIKDWFIRKQEQSYWRGYDEGSKERNFNFAVYYKNQAPIEQFCDDLQRMKRLEEDSEEFQRGLSIVK